jgi:hypothetical protein
MKCEANLIGAEHVYPGLYFVKAKSEVNNKERAIKLGRRLFRRGQKTNQPN